MSGPLSDNAGKDPQTTQKFWDEAHSRDEICNLTGTSGPKEWQTLRAVDFVKPGRRVLNIGVGLGKGTFDLVAAGCRVSVLDISLVALNRVRQKVEAAYLPENLASLPDRHFDLALSHLVVQHMSDADFAVQLKHVIRSLKEDGVFALQFATAWNQESGSIRYEPPGSDARPYARTLAQMMEFAEAAGATIIFAQIVARFLELGMSWFAVHIVPRAGFHAHGGNQAV